MKLLENGVISKIDHVFVV